MYAKTEGDVRTREFFYNGKNLTQYSPFLKYYTTVDSPPKLSDTLHLIEDHYGIQVAMEDLFLIQDRRSNGWHFDSMRANIHSLASIDDSHYLTAPTFKHRWMWFV
ncbi:MAG: DUF2092 domain-containing protein [Pseudomonas sp.]